MQYQKVIEQLGYTPREAKVYLASLRLGEAHISDIAQKVQLPRTSAQVIVDKLHADGLMNFYIMRRYKYWVAENPERLLTNLKKREENIEAALPALAEMRKIARQKKHNKDPEHAVNMMKVCADNFNQPMLVADEEALIVYVNTAWEKQFGYVLDEVQNKSTKMLASGKTKPHVYKAMWQALDNGRLFQTSEVVDKRKDGSLFSTQTTVLIMEHGETKYFVQVLEETK
jgi:PAS domain S-box-containing protein